MSRGADRKVARAWVALAAVVLLVAVVGTHPGAPVRRSSRTIALELLNLAASGDKVAFRVDYRTTRVLTGGGTLGTVVTVWSRPKPALYAELSSGQLTITLAGESYSCSRIASRPQCLRTGRTNTAVRSSDPFVAAIVSRRYDVLDAPARTVAGGRARCFVVRLRKGAAVVEGLGYRVVSCFAADGIVLASAFDHPGAHDERVATRVVRGLSVAELRHLARTATDGTIPPFN